jgi:hypothetical protein
LPEKVEIAAFGFDFQTAFRRSGLQKNFIFFGFAFGSGDDFDAPVEVFDLDRPARTHCEFALRTLSENGDAEN